MNQLPWKCVGNNITRVLYHVRKVNHIIDGKYDVMIIQKFNEDPYLFKYLDYYDFRSKQHTNAGILHTTFNAKFLNSVLN